MFRWLRPAPAGPAASLAMLGPKPADAALIIGTRGAGGAAVAADMGAVTRLNGRTVVADTGADAETAVARAAERTGALVEFVDAPADALPFDAASFTLVILPELAAWPDDRRAARLAEAVRVLQPGGRVAVLMGGAGGGLVGRFRAHAPSLDDDTTVALLGRSGLVAARRLAQTEGVTYFEARKPRPTA